MVSRKRTRAAGYTTPETKTKKDNHQIFVRSLPIIGEVPMLFYTPPCKQADQLREDIEYYGGKVVDTYEAYVYQIKIPKGGRKTSKTFHRGYVYSSEWIYDSIENGKLIEEIDDYLVGFHKKSDLYTIPKGTRKQYTITEVLRIWECVESERMKNSPPMSFFQKIEAENIIPDRSAQSLRTAWKKFSKITKNKFIKAALNKAGTKYSHNFDDVPEHITASKMKKPKAFKKNLASVFNSASTKPNLDESSSQSETMAVDMNVMTKEPSIIDRNDEDVEFILAIEDMQSVVSNDMDCNEPYNLHPRKRRRTPLNTLFENYADRSGFKRVKVTESENNGYDYNS